MEEPNVCAICLEDKLSLPYSLPCKHKFCYLCLKQAAQKGNMKCPLCRAEIPPSVLEEARISSDINPDENQGRWLYSGRWRGWWFYDPDVDYLIEKSWEDYSQKTGPATFLISILGKKYCIDFRSMKQTCIEGCAQRKIKRINEFDEDDIVKGIAGLRVVIKPIPRSFEHEI